MWSKFIFLFFCVSILTIDGAFAQKKPGIKDSAIIYKNIESYSGKRKFTKFIFRSVFRPVAISKPKKEANKNPASKKQKQNPYSAFEGKIISHIYIITLDPFGFSVTDTIVIPQNFLSKTGNKLHVKSQNTTIRNLLLIKENQIFDSLLVKESERLVRSRNYVHDVSFSFMSTSKNSDSVDIFIRELDNWSIVPRVAASNTRLKIILTDKNFAGFGHEMQNNYIWYHTSGSSSYKINYYIPNIHNTYINTTLHYESDEFRNSISSLSIDRPFFSSFTKWAGGMFFTQQYRKDLIKTDDSLTFKQTFKFNTQNYWAGYATQVFKGNTENDRTTNLIYAVHYYRIRYIEKPIEIYDTNHLYSNQDFYLASIGISTRKYKQDKYIFRFGVTEDVPIGRVFNITGGYQVKNNTSRLYLGARISFGNYYRWGYISSNFEYGTYFRISKAEQGVFNAGINYHTRLLEIGNWKFRQFVKPQISIGIKRFTYESLTLNDGIGLDGFNSSTLTGNSRLLFTWLTQSYAPWNLIGFQFGPYLIYSMGMLEDAVTGFNKSRIYTQIGLGVLIKNEYLISSTFQFSISYYPLIPGTGVDVLKVNSFRTTDFGFRNFEIGTPGTVAYQ